MRALLVAYGLLWLALPVQAELPTLPDLPGESSSDATPFVSKFRISGNTVFAEAELQAVVAPFSNRRIGSEDLVAARSAISRLYAAHGYATSGAFIPDQVPVDGSIEIRVVEGRLSDVEVSGTDQLSGDFIRSRFKSLQGGVLQLSTLEADLQRLNRSPSVSGVRAVIRPGDLAGESILSLAVREERRFSASTYYDNASSPGIDSNVWGQTLAVANLLGREDRLGLSFGRSRGFDEFEARYSVPLLANDTSLDLFFHSGEFEVVRGPSADFKLSSGKIDSGIRAKSRSYGLALRRPVFQTRGKSLLFELSAERRWSRSYLLDIPFGFEAADPSVRLSILRVRQEWLSRGESDVLAARSSFSWGLGVGSSDENRSARDDTFFSWLGQLQWAHRLSGRLSGWELVSRADVQLARDSLFSMEQIALGGASSVRGYRENLFVRDNAIVGSVEVRVPLWRNPDGRSVLQAAPFFDLGRGWNSDGPERRERISSLGLGLRYQPSDRLQLSLYWGSKLRSAQRVEDDWLQDHGFHIQATLRNF